ncbi:DUF3696 domain-containing protein [Nostoc sp. DSM 114160]|jgi:predicted ATPase
MLDSLSLKNFKGFQYLENLNTKPITVLCGTNSCGKTSILQSILLLKQTLESQNPNQTLLLNGRLVHLGTFENIIFDKNLDNKIELNFRFKISKDDQQYSSGSNRLKMRMFLGEFLSTRETQLASHNINFKVVLKSYKNQSKSKKSLKTVIVDQIYFKLETLMPDKQIIPGAFIKLELIDSDLYKIQWENITNRIMLRQDSEKKGEVHVKIKFTNLFSMRIINFDNTEEKVTRIPDITFLLYTINNMLQSIFSSYTYIGPLREEPSRRYIYEDEILEIGIKGENAAYIYSNEQSQDVVNHFFYDIRSNSFQQKPFLKLSVAVQEWLDLMNIKGFKTATLNEIIYLELNSSSASKTRVNIADVGFGVSQIFPIILEGLRMPWRSTLLLEQPEIHLHPNLQMQMADYFISLALSGKKVIVETHSDHIINRLVRRIVESETNQFKDLIAIYFISNTENGSIYEEIKIDDERGVVNWPSGFFDQVANEQENIIRAGLRKRKFNRNKNL